MKFFGGFLFVILCLINSCKSSETIHISLLSIRSSTESNRSGLTKHQCEAFAREYLDFLLLKNSFFYRVKLTSKYQDSLLSETDPDLTKSAQARYNNSLEKMIQLSKEVESMLENAKKLFEILIKCLTIYGQEFSPEKIFNNNKDLLKHLSSVDAILK